MAWVNVKVDCCVRGCQLRRVLFGVAGTSASVRRQLKLQPLHTAALQTSLAHIKHETVGKINWKTAHSYSVCCNSHGIREASSDQQWLLPRLRRGARSSAFEEARRRAGDDHLHAWYA